MAAVEQACRVGAWAAQEQVPWVLVASRANTGQGMVSSQGARAALRLGQVAAVEAVVQVGQQAMMHILPSHQQGGTDDDMGSSVTTEKLSSQPHAKELRQFHRPAIGRWMSAVSTD
jgi:hypothetical protein